MEPSKPAKQNSNSTTILSPHHLYMYFLCYFVKYAHHKTLYMQACYTLQLSTYILAMSAILSSTCVSCCHPQQNSLSKDINMSYTPSTTPSTTFHKPPMHTKNTRHIVGKMAQEVRIVIVVSSLGWFLRVLALHARFCDFIIIII